MYVVNSVNVGDSELIAVRLKAISELSVSQCLMMLPSEGLGQCEE